ncbi:MAG TPA: P1 family peptidase [Ilumatobacteraceae bacterium]
MAGAITDVPGVRVGHVQRTTRGWRTGTTVVYVPDGATAGVDVRGGGPGTRETDALHPSTLVDRVHAVCLTGGSAFGLAAADGVMSWLEPRGLGVKVGPEPSHVVPVVPTAVIFDLGRGGDFAKRPDPSFGARAIAGARATTPRGAVGAGTGAIAGGLQGGVGTASATVDDVVVGALVVVNAAGSLVDPATGLPWYAGGARLRRPDAAARTALADALAARIVPPLNTTIGVIATSAALTKAEASKLASIGHDGMARAIRPVHSMFDGDTVFALALGRDELPAPGVRFRDPASRPGVFSRILAAGAACFADACTDALLSATSIGGPPSYRELCGASTERD